MMSELATALAAQYERLKSLTDCVALLLTIFYAASRIGAQVYLIDKNIG